MSNNMHVTIVQEAKEIEWDRKNSEKMMTENVPNLMECMCLQVQKNSQVSTPI